MAQRRPALAGDEIALRRRREHAALGDDGEVEALGDAGVDLDAARRGEVLQRRDGAPKRLTEPLRLARLRLDPARCSGATIAP